MMSRWSDALGEGIEYSRFEDFADTIKARKEVHQRRTPEFSWEGVRLSGWMPLERCAPSFAATIR